MSEKLKDCPFCGGEASVHRCEHAFHDAKIRCAGCQAEGPIFDVDDGEANEAGRNEADAIAAWNRRTPAPEGEAWRVVPVEPTEAMIAAANALWGDSTGVNYVQLEPEDFYAAMLAASPVVPVGWRDIATAPKDGSDILILASGMAIEARYAPGAWGPDVPGEVQEYDGPVWVAFDDLTQFEIEEGVLEGGKDHHGAVTHWMPLPPAPTDTGRE